VCGQPLAAVSQFDSGLLKRWAIWFARGELVKGAVMSDEFHFNDEDDAKAEIRAAVRYLLEGIAGTDRGDIVREIIAIVNEVARGLPSGGEDPLDDGMPGGWATNGSRSKKSQPSAAPKPSAGWSISG
jgi:hypothetical protein